MEEARRWTDRAIRRQIDLSSLTAERERHLLRVVHGSSNERTKQTALIELWESHSKLVVAIASRYRYLNIDLLDLVGAGHLGLHAAIGRFDPDRFETRLSTYAIAWIRRYIQDYVRRNSGPVRLPSSNAHRQLMQMRGRLLAEARKSCQRERVEPTESELCERIGRRIGLSGDEVARSMRLIQGGTLSLHGDGQSGEGHEAGGHARRRCGFPGRRRDPPPRPRQGAQAHRCPGTGDSQRARTPGVPGALHERQRRGDPSRFVRRTVSRDPGNASISSRPARNARSPWR